MSHTKLQSDLFEISPLGTGLGSEREASFLERFRVNLRFDQVLLVVIVGLIFNLLIYSFGVETGKKRTQTLLEAERLKNKQIILEMTQQVKYQPQPTVEEAAAAGLLPSEVNVIKDNATAPQVDVPKAETAPVLPQGKYTIQFATYTSKLKVERQITKLKERGLQGFIIPSGKYMQLCVNAFQDRSEAASKLSKLKSNGTVPSDAFVRIKAS